MKKITSTCLKGMLPIILVLMVYQSPSYAQYSPAQLNTFDLSDVQLLDSPFEDGEEVPIQGQYAGSEQYENFDLTSVDVPALKPKTNDTADWIKSTEKILVFELTGVREADGNYPGAFL